MKTYKLKATLQKDYYGKAKVIENDDGVIQLKSYETIVCEYNTNTKEFKKLWQGYSNTTARHIKDFIKLFNIDFNFSKKEWLKETDKDNQYYCEFSNGYITWNTKNTLLFDNYDDAENYIDSVISKNKLLQGWVC